MKIYPAEVDGLNAQNQAYPPDETITDYIITVDKEILGVRRSYFTST